MVSREVMDGKYGELEGVGFLSSFGTRPTRPETLILPKDLWQRVTGLTGDEQHVIRDSAMSWGNYVHIMTAPAMGDMSFGPVNISNPPVTYVDWPDPTMANMSLMGNAPFVDSFVVVLDCISNRFGVSKVK